MCLVSVYGGCMEHRVCVGSRPVVSGLFIDYRLSLIKDRSVSWVLLHTALSSATPRDAIAPSPLCRWINKVYCICTFCLSLKLCIRTTRLLVLFLLVTWFTVIGALSCPELVLFWIPQPLWIDLWMKKKQMRLVVIELTIFLLIAAIHTVRHKYYNTPYAHATLSVQHTLVNTQPVGPPLL